jgi:hypothetical protein
LAILKFVCPKEKVLSEWKMTLTLFLDFKKVFAVVVFIQIGLMTGKSLSIIPTRTGRVKGFRFLQKFMTL